SIGTIQYCGGLETKPLLELDFLSILEILEYWYNSILWGFGDQTPTRIGFFVNTRNSRVSVQFNIVGVWRPNPYECQYYKLSEFDITSD
ncbi:hypothetical protein, partial [Hydrocoleum sp. CS-953]|uniref:hypothetical protein n=1 Tax=Hydrocoleum sp. CS-953 TaxID=1671698 RepID=UPI001AEF741B